ncbi:hydroxyproline dehydrogenase isoform X4 [Patagioenas fasciata]|uniref:hydroxyproline dehydrogenase isoform X4 n=1 Tax=Patagioenas fasciata TaxID=372321 RepID=UPI003A99E3DF
MGRPPAPGTPLNIGGRALRGLRYGELGRALLVLGLCALPPIVRHAEAILWVSRRVLGRHLWVRLLRATFYGQFVGGRTHRELEATAPRLRSMGLRPIVAVPCEGDVGQEPQGESWYEANQRAALEGVGLAAAMGPEPMMQLRVTALLSARLCEDLGRCPAGEGLTMERAAAMMGGEEAALPALTPNQNRHLGVALRRLEEVAKAAVGRGVRLLLDAELSALDPPLATVTWALARRHNPERPWVWGTIQAYRRGAPERLWGSAAALRGSRFGVKLVRGAYLESERRAGGGARIHPTADATHRRRRNACRPCTSPALAAASSSPNSTGCATTSPSLWEKPDMTSTNRCRWDRKRPRCPIWCGGLKKTAPFWGGGGGIGRC